MKLKGLLILSLIWILREGEHYSASTLGAEASKYEFL